MSCCSRTERKSCCRPRTSAPASSCSSSSSAFSCLISRSSCFQPLNWLRASYFPRSTFKHCKESGPIAAAGPFGFFRCSWHLINTTVAPLATSRAPRTRSASAQLSGSGALTSKDFLVPLRLPAQELASDRSAKRSKKNSKAFCPALAFLNHPDARVSFGI